ncbi:hypothetical protein CEE44_02500 [Candidatus Woesearchaeota archaeon B3_Woes]|nr:MAG: hypothetical protein CEE44_02500 [Candidatus Woesearchaeota archaeon B3_Woes]
MKKAQGLSLQTIVISILALIVLAVILFVFSGKIGDVKTSLDSCTEKGGECKTPCSYGATIKTQECDDCCIPIGKAAGS